MTSLIFFKLIINILENRVSFFIILSTIFCIYFNNLELIYCIDDLPTNKSYIPYNPNYVPTSQGFRIELDSRSIYEMNNQESFPVNNNEYQAYNYNYVPTNQGYRIELDNNEIINNRNTFRIPNVSHYPNNNSSELLGTIHTNDNFSPNLGLREDTTSEINSSDLYNSLSNCKVEYVHTPTTIECIKGKFTKIAKSIDRYYEKNYERSILREKSYTDSLKSTRYIRGHG